MSRRWKQVLAGCFTAVAMPALAEQAPQAAPELFNQTSVWTVHLKFTPEQWTAIEPKGVEGARPFGPPPGGGPGGRGPGGFRPSDMFVPAFLAGDTNGDGNLSSAEFRSLGQAWFGKWSPSGQPLTAEQLRANARQSIAPLRPPREGPGGGPGLLGPEGGRNGLSAAAGIQFEYVHADLEFQGQTLRDVAVRYKGNNTFMMARNSIKRSFKIDLNKYTKGQSLAGQTTLNLHNNITDASWMNEVLSYQLFRDAGVPAPRTSYARVFVTVPGKYERKYFGLYSLVEDIGERFAEDRFGSDEGAIFKPVTRELFGYMGADWSRYNQTYDPKTKLTKAQKSRVIEFARFVTEASDADFAAGIAGYLDLDEFARFMAVTVWLSNADSILGMGQNFYVYLDAKTNRFQFLPWDLDHSFGQFPMGGGGSESLSINRPWQGRNRFLERVFQVPAFHKLYLSKMAEYNASIFSARRIVAQVDKVGAAIRPAVAEESASLLTRLDAAVAGKASSEDRGPDRGPMGPPRNPIKTFVVARSQSVANQLHGKAESTPPEGPRSFGPDRMVDRLFLPSFDTDSNGILTQKEFAGGFERWFRSWNTDGDGHLTSEEIRNGLGGEMPPPPMPPGRPF